jgi:hypothetical protein
MLDVALLTNQSSEGFGLSLGKPVGTLREKGFRAKAVAKARDNGPIALAAACRIES